MGGEDAAQRYCEDQARAAAAAAGPHYPDPTTAAAADPHNPDSTTTAAAADPHDPDPTAAAATNGKVTEEAPDDSSAAWTPMTPGLAASGALLALYMVGGGRRHCSPSHRMFAHSVPVHAIGTA